MIVKNVLLFTLNFLLIFPVSVFGQFSEEETRFMVQQSLDATGGNKANPAPAQNPQHESVHIHPSGGGAQEGGGNFFTTIFSGVISGANNYAGIINDNAFDLFSSRLSLLAAYEYITGADEHIDFEEGFNEEFGSNERSFRLKNQQEARGICNAIEGRMEQRLSDYANQDPPIASNRYDSLMVQDIAPYVLSGGERLAPAENEFAQKLFRHNTAMMSNLFEGLAQLCSSPDHFASNSANPNYCGNRRSGEIASACEKFMAQIADEDELNDGLAKDVGSVEQIMAVNATNYVQDIRRTPSEVSEPDSPSLRSTASSRTDANSGTLFCDGSRESCYFTRNSEQFNSGSLCNEFDCTMIGSAENAFGQDNAQIVKFLSNWAGVDNNINSLGDEAFCNGCMESKHLELSTNKDFGESKEEMAKLVNDKLQEMMAKRAVLDHSSYIDNILDMVAISQLGDDDQALSQESMPQDLFCAQEIQGLIDMSSCGGTESSKARLKERNKKIFAEVLKSLGINGVNENNVSGQNVVNSIIALSEEKHRTPACDGDRELKRTNGRTRFVMEKMANWNSGDGRFQKRELNELLNNLITADGIHNSSVLVGDSMQSICQKNPSQLAAMPAPRNKIAEMSSNVINTLMMKLESGEISCNESLEANSDYSFTPNTIFYRAICFGGQDGSGLGHEIADFQNKDDHYIRSIASHIPESIVERASANQSINRELRKAHIKRKVEELISTGMNADPRYSGSLGSWSNICDAYVKANQLEQDNDALTNFDFEDFVNGYKDLSDEQINKSMTALRNSNCQSINTKLRSALCEEDIEINPDDNIQKYGGLNFNAEDIADAVRAVANDLDDADKLALSSYSCEVRSSMKRNQLQDDPALQAEIGLFDSVLDSAQDRPLSGISSVELGANPELAQKVADLDYSQRPDFDPERLCKKDNFCLNANQLKSGLGWDISCRVDIANVDTGGDQDRSGSTGSSGRTNSSSGAGGSSVYNADNYNVAASGGYRPTSNGVNTPSSNNVGSSGNNGAIANAASALAQNPALGNSAVGGNTTLVDNNISNTPENSAGLTASGGSDLLSSFVNQDGSMGAFNANANQGNTSADIQFMDRQIKDLQAQQRNEMLNGDSESQVGRGPASVASADDMDIANMSEEELRALSDRLGIDMNELRQNASRSKKEIQADEESGIGQLLKAMEEQNKSNQEVIAALQEQNKGLTERLTRVENAATSSVNNSASISVDGGSESPSSAFKSANFAFDLDSNTFRNKSTITGEERQSFSPDFATTGQNAAAANFSGYSESRRSAMRSRDSEINKEFLSIVAGESGSFDAFETSKESVEQYVDFVNKKGSIVHLVRYDEKGRPVSIKVPWSSEEIPLVGEYAVLKDKIPPQSDALTAEEADYGLYKMVEFSQSLQTFFASEAQEQVQLSSLINELDDAETSVE